MSTFFSLRNMAARTAVASAVTLAFATATVAVTTPAPAATSHNESVLSLPISIPYATIQKLVNDKAPRMVTGEKSDPTNMLSEDWVRWQMKRGEITVSNGGSCIAIAVPISGSATAGGRFGVTNVENITRYIPFIGDVVKKVIHYTLSAPVQETANFSGTVHGCVSFTIAPDWTLKPSVDLRLDLDRAEVRLIKDLIPISFRTLATDEFNKQKDSIVRDVTAGVVSGLNVQARVKQAWEAMHVVYPVATAPEVYARVRPQRVIWQPLSYRDPAAVTFGVGLVAQVDTFVGVKPTPPPITPVPNIDTTTGRAGVSQLRVPVVLNLKAVNTELAKKLADGPLDVGEDSKLQVTSAMVTDEDGSALLTLGYEVKRRWYLHNLSGKVQIRARPVLNSRTQTLSFSDLNYTLKTRSTLVNASAWLLKPVVLKTIEQRARVDLAPHLEAVRASANTQARLVAAKLGTASELQMKRLSVDGLAIGSGVVIAVVSSDVATVIQLAAVN